MFSNIIKKGDHQVLPQTEEDAKEMEALTDPSTSIEADDEIDEEELEENEIIPVARRKAGRSKKKYLLIASILVACVVGASVAVVKISGNDAVNPVEQNLEERKNNMFKDLKFKEHTESDPEREEKKPKKNKKDDVDVSNMWPKGKGKDKEPSNAGTSREKDLDMSDMFPKGEGKDEEPSDAGTSRENDLDVSDMWPKGEGKDEEPSEAGATKEKPGQSKEKPTDASTTNEKPEEKPIEVAQVVSTPESPPKEEASKPEITERPDYLPEFTWNAIQKDPESSQAKAWKWVQDHPDFGTGTMPSWRTRQLMGLVTVLGTNLASFLRSFNGDYECQWRGFADVPNCTWDGQYQNLNLHDMGLKDTIPPEVSLLPALATLDLSKNNFTGPIPTEIGLVSNLMVLDLSKNPLHTTIPSELGQLKKSVRSIRIHDAELKGTIPTTLGNLEVLQQLRFDKNDLTGQFPSELGELRTLEYLDLSENQLSGRLPEEFGKLMHTQIIQLQDNMFTGMLSTHFRFMKHGCNLQGNMFRKPIPRNIGCKV